MFTAASAAASSSGQGAGGARASAKTTTSSAAHGQKRAGVAVGSAAVKTARVFAAGRIARAFAGERGTHVAIAVDRGSLNLTCRVVARASHHGNTEWATAIAASPFTVGHALVRTSEK